MDPVVLRLSNFREIRTEKQPTAGSHSYLDRGIQRKWDSTSELGMRKRIAKVIKEKYLLKFILRSAAVKVSGRFRHIFKCSES